MNSELFGVRNVKPDENPKKQGRSETSLSLRCAVRVADSSLMIFRRKRISLHVRLIARISRKNGFESDTARLPQIPNITRLSFQGFQLKCNNSLA